MGSKRRRKRTRILVVDDDPLVLNILRKRLERDGYAVSVAATAADGMALCRRQRADLVLVDIRLPDKSGHDLIADIKAEFPKARVIAITGAYRGPIPGVPHTLAKPFTSEQLGDAVRDALAG